MKLKGIKFDSIEYEPTLLEKIMKVSNMIEKANRNKASWVIYTSSDMANKIERAMYDIK